MIMYNAVRTYTAGGDFYAEIIREKQGKIVNLKPLNPGTVKVIATGNGMIKKYEVYPINSMLTTSEKNIVELKKEEVFHLAYNRMADQIHGEGVIKKLMPIIEMIWQKNPI